MANSDKFPLDWDVWITQWRAWFVEQLSSGKFKTVPHNPFGHKSVLATAVLGVWLVNGRIVELSEVTMPDFNDKYSGPDAVRLVGITYRDDNGLPVAGPVTHSFAELEDELYAAN